MRNTWRATCLGLIVLGPLLTACGGADDSRKSSSTESSAGSSAPPTPGVYGQPDPNVEVPTEVATDSPAPTAPAGDDVAPQLTYFGWNADIRGVEAGGFVPSLVEAGGTCTLTLSKGATEVEASSQAVDNVTSTSCAEMVVPGDRLSSGVWKAVLSYESETSQGVSGAVEVEVP
ncbi:hypothetical protein [Candidatus Blastococcus massiliensis]|uniref:hypothetical protein n=1 Tax=Candidatus Blastococcus massiliensis TaxID=1470358 RepID=UPI0012DF279E|nr:hypothetical protein [Candidatus Blastococcus massiliensis]